MKSFNLIRNSLKSKHRVNNFSSILKNKDQTGKSDKSYCGTDTKHSLGSDRVVDDKDKTQLTTIINDSKVHHEKNINPDHDRPDQTKSSKEQDLKNETIKPPEI
jgi:hypothetical protein